MLVKHQWLVLLRLQAAEEAVVLPVITQDAAAVPCQGVGYFLASSSNQPGPNGHAPRKVSQPKQTVYVPMSPTSRQQSKESQSLDNKQTNQLLVVRQVSLGSRRSLRRRADDFAGTTQLLPLNRHTLIIDSASGICHLTLK